MSDADSGPRGACRACGGSAMSCRTRWTRHRRRSRTSCKSGCGRCETDTRSQEARETLGALAPDLDDEHEHPKLAEAPEMAG